MRGRGHWSPYKEGRRTVGKTWADRLLVAGLFLGGMSIYLFTRGPAVSEQHRLFRLAVPAVGLLLVIIGSVMKASGRRSDAP